MKTLILQSWGCTALEKQIRAVKPWGCPLNACVKARRKGRAELGLCPEKGQGGVGAQGFQERAGMQNANRNKMQNGLGLSESWSPEAG